MNAHLLVVEDDRNVRNVVCSSLRRQGYLVAEAATADDCHRQLADHRFDLILLDLNLPDEDGISLLRHVRSRSRAPVFVVSGRGDEHTRLEALALGADDYVHKPFSVRELELRVSNFLARQQERQTVPGRPITGWQFDRWTLKLDRRIVVSDDGESPELTRGEFEVLVCLLRGGGDAVDRDAIIAHLDSSGSAMSRESLTTVVYRLRRKLGGGRGRQSTLIATLHGVGFRLLTRVTPV